MLSQRCGKDELEYGDEGRTLRHLIGQTNLETDSSSLDRWYGNIDITNSPGGTACPHGRLTNLTAAITSNTAI
jgi:hypothetical protein